MRTGLIRTGVPAPVGTTVSGSDKFSKVVGSVSMAQNLYRLGKEFYDGYQNKHQYRVSIDNTDEMFAPMNKWLLDHVTNQSRFVSMHSEWKNERLLPYAMFDTNNEQAVTINGHTVRVSMQKPESSPGGPVRSVRGEVKLNFVCKTEAAQQAVVDLYMELCKDKSREGIHLYTVTQWSDWDKNYLPAKSIDAVVLRDGQKERILKDINSFLDAESKYVRAGIPWHRGYLLYGPPGTGKTSLVKALAAEFQMNVYYLSLGDMDKDSKLMSLIQSVPKKSLLLLEDIDVFNASHKREADSEELSLSALLNALDGVATPHGLITFMSTNHVEVLDEAIIRPGRVDMKEEIGYTDASQANKMFEFLFEEPLGATGGFHEVAPAQITEVFKRNMTDPAAARQEILSWQLDTNNMSVLH